jgi:hypothetical protein
MKRIGLADNPGAAIDGQQAQALPAAEVRAVAEGNTSNLAFVGGMNSLHSNPGGRLQCGEGPNSVSAL